MNLVSKLEQLDSLVSQGRIQEAFEQFFAENVITHSGDYDRSVGKADKRERLRYFFDSIANVNNIILHGSEINGNVTLSDFTFDFTSKSGAPLFWREIIRRTWADGLVVDEEYLRGSLNAETKKDTAKKEAPVKKAIAKATTDEKPKPAAKNTATKADDLKLIEGIGPKIADLLIAAGIKTFADLANTKPAKIKEVLDAAGSRFTMHDPTTWPEQAKMASKGEWSKLKTWQDQLKAGKTA